MNKNETKQKKNMLGTKHVTYQNLALSSEKKQKKFMITGLKKSSLAYKCIFYRPEYNTKGKPQEN